MKRRGHLALLLLFTFLTGPLLALPDPPADALKANRARLEQIKRDPEHLARLRRELQVFLELPEERREQIVKLDHDLQRNGRLMDALERYADWLHGLDEKQRQAIKDASDRAARLRLIQELRDEGWMKRQPKARREQWASLKSDARSEYVRTLRQEERQQRREWQIAGQFWKELESKQPMPVRLADFNDKELKLLVEDYLMHLLSPVEKERLKKAEGRWPDYPLTLVELADRHPFALPGPDGPRHFAALPQAVQNRFRGTKSKDPTKAKEFKEPARLRKAEGRWPDFAVAVVEQQREMEEKRKQPLAPFPHELWAYNFHSLQKPMQEYVEKVLQPALTPDGKLRLLNAAGRWPGYPQAIQELARAHNLPPPPWQTALPTAAKERWDTYRALSVADLPAVPRHQLEEFAIHELDAKERAELHLSPTDPAGWHRLRAIYFQRKPGELHRLRGKHKDKKGI